MVDLSHNPHLSEVKPFAFPRILHLSHLSLAWTNVTSLRSDAVPWERLGFLDLAGIKDTKCLQKIFSFLSLSLFNIDAFFAPRDNEKTFKKCIFL